jgi:UDP-galactopyranose mutase
MAGWDICLLPFAFNGTTRLISPAKTLEYMAATRPSVSTRIRDVGGALRARGKNCHLGAEVQ